MAFLEIKNVGKSYAAPRGARRVLAGVELSLEQGEFAAVVGGSGSGKTTLVSLIAGLAAPDEGTITLEGRPVEGPGPERGVIFQNYSLLPWMSVLENVLLAVEAVAPRLSRAEQKERAEHFVRLVRLEKALWKRPRELSGGMRQRVAVARGLAMDPKVLLLDEPFSALDALTRAGLQDELARIWQETKKTVIMITNDVDEAVLLADRIHALAPPSAGAGAALGPAIAVDISRPRLRKELSLEPSYQEARRRLVEALTRRRPARGAEPPPRTAAAAALSLEGGR